MWQMTANLHFLQSHSAGAAHKLLFKVIKMKFVPAERNSYSQNREDLRVIRLGLGDAAHAEEEEKGDD